MIQVGVLDQSQIISRIRRYQQDIFSQQQESEFSFQYSQSQNHIEDRISPYIKPIRPSVATPTKFSNTKKHQNYQSPYSLKSTKDQMNNYSNSSNKKTRKKIFQMYKEQQKIQEQKAKIRKQSHNKKFESIKPKYLQKQPLIKNIQQIQQNIYGRLKTQTEHIRKNRSKRSLSKQQVDQRWSNFIKKNHQWQQARQTSRIKAKINKNIEIKQQMNARIPRKSPPKMTVDDYLQKLRRHAEKLKQKLNQYTFQPKLYEAERRKHKQSKQKRQQQRKQLENTAANLQKQFHEQRKQKKFTIINNPKKQFSFIFK